MSPSEALQNPIFVTYVWIVAGLIGSAGVVLAFFTWVLKKEMRSVWLTYRSWLIMAPLILGSVFLGRVVTILVLSLLAVLGFKEFARATGLYRDWWMTGAVYVGIVAACVLTLVRHPTAENAGMGWYGFFMTLPVYAIALIMMIPIVRNRVEGQLQTISLAIVGFLYIGWMFGHIGFLANPSHHYGYLLFLIFAVELNDVAAFTFGRLLGKHQFRSQISPKKTWEGAIGALCFSMVLPWLLRFSFPQFGTLQLVLTGLIVGIGGQLGDLSISVIKRDIGIKDMGVTIPGHGGILDRIDSLIYTAPLFMHMVDFYNGLN
jgi:phosphatidate cytidylyltransferase